jgi:ectoine hydroxylase-related dioxygenase (phytanoyl-CoA dioxygenase family)
MSVLVQESLLGLQCVLTLDEFTSENGATQLIEGSHQPASRPDIGTSKSYRTVEAQPGSLLVMAAATWHRSGFNASWTPRAGILLSFVERWVRPMIDRPEPGPWAETGKMRIMFGHLERLAQGVCKDAGARWAMSSTTCDRLG